MARQRLPHHLAAAIAFGSASAFGLIVELIQLSLTHREPQVSDAMLDVTGSAVGVAALAMVSLPVLRRPQLPAIVGTVGTMLVASTLAAIVWLDPGPDRFCPGTVSDEPLQSAGLVRPRADGADRVDAGLTGLFDFTEESTTSRSAAFDLMARGAVEHLEPFGVRILGADALISSRGPAPQIVDRITDQFTLEAWVRPTR